jgi:hypothetical protein
MSWSDLSPHAQSIWRWIARDEAKRNAPPTAAQQIYPHLRSETRGAPVEQPKRNDASVAATIYPNLRRR